jgi:hypothetical protein
MKITASEAINYLYEASKKSSGKLSNKRALLGIMVTTKVRNEVLTDSDQGGIVIDGTPKTFKFKSMGGGVWLMTVGNKDYKQQG